MKDLLTIKRELGLTYSGLADALGCSRISAIRYANGNRRIPPHNAINAEKKLGIPKEILRPDIWQTQEAL